VNEDAMCMGLQWTYLGHCMDVIVLTHTNRSLQFIKTHYTTGGTTRGVFF
jgi:hypothetical protein